ncbi:hypothetical protein K2173_018340 [Erythroxylum novogranatense]|uniref:4-hydroxy-3-methylbut-2-enyl diphosphate reductase n=1 Tax=Erythroxylum novogranatense TaxID=1862640 RepID=A0AAV8UEW2_9ROSI|nr:hypothetical protein K2173_018340 [Erythroxylum novogranatense]
MKVENIPVDGAKKHFEVVNHDDVVSLPAFGAVVDEMLTLSNKNVQIALGYLRYNQLMLLVWNTVEKHEKGEYKSIIHGKYAHEETIATASFAGKYIIVKDMKEISSSTAMSPTMAKNISDKHIIEEEESILADNDHNLTSKWC